MSERAPSSSLSRNNSSFRWTNVSRPLGIYCVLWSAISVLVIVLSFFTNMSPHRYMLVGSILSMFGTLFILISGATSSEAHRKKYHYVYCLTLCVFFTTMKLLITASLVLDGLSVKWQDEHKDICIFLALWGYLSTFGSLGYCLVLLIDVAIVISFPLWHSRYASILCTRYHITIWILIALGCVPPLAAHAIGASAHGTCYFSGVYGNAYAYIEGIVLLCCVIVCAYLLYYCMSLDTQQSQRPLQLQITNRPTVMENVLLRSVLTAASFIFAVVWNHALHVLDYINYDIPHWLNALQSFWMGGLGFSCAMVWYPFIKRSLMQVGGDIIGRLTPRHKQVKVISRMQIQTVQTNFNSIQTDEDGGEVVAAPIIYTIPSRWQQETVNTYRGPTGECLDDV